MKNTN